jgi:hypothetical protein
MHRTLAVLLSVLASTCWGTSGVPGQEEMKVQDQQVREQTGGRAAGPFVPFGSLADALDGPRSGFFGITPQRRPKDAKTRYAAGGVSGAEEPPTFHLSFEVTNNQMLCSLTSTGLLRNPCIFSGLVPASRRGRSFTGEQLLGGSPWSFAIRRKGGEAVSLHLTHGVGVELLGNLFPLFSYECEGLRTRLLAFAPEAGGPDAVRPRAVVAVLQVANPGADAVEASLLVPSVHDLRDVDLASAVAAPCDSPHPRFTENPVPIRPGYEAVMCLDDIAWRPAFPEIRFGLRPDEQIVFAFAFVLGESPEELRKTGEVVRGRSALDWFNQTWQSRIERYGRLSIPDDPYYAESYVRLVEEGSSAILHTTDGVYWGGGPSGFSDFAMALFEPRFVADVITRSLAGHRPRRDDEPRPAEVTYSLVGALGPLPSVGLYYRMTGDRAFLRGHPEVLAFARERLADIVKAREGEPFLFPSKMLWDGPSRGDYHTGSNVFAWMAFDGMARVARDAYGEPKLADEWSGIASNVKRDILRYCVGEGSLGRQFYEGGNRDGTFIAGHDGEEAFTTLMPFFGFCEADDPAYINHARLALSPENPLYVAGVDGIAWADGRDGSWHGNWTEGSPPARGPTTMPGQMAMLAGIANERELHDRLEQLRGLTDLDGSIWWWPYSYPATDPALVRRRDVGGCDLSKSGYAAAIYLCLFVNNILGLSVDVPARQVSLRPFSPWRRFAWEGCRLGAARFDFHYEDGDGRVMGKIANRNEQVFDGTIELTLPEGARLVSCRVNGRPTEEVERTERYGRSAVRLRQPIAPGEVLEVKADYRIGGP